MTTLPLQNRTEHDRQV